MLIPQNVTGENFFSQSELRLAKTHTEQFSDADFINMM